MQFGGLLSYSTQFLLDGIDFFLEREVVLFISIVVIGGLHHLIVQLHEGEGQGILMIRTGHDFPARS